MNKRTCPICGKEDFIPSIWVWVTTDAMEIGSSLRSNLRDVIICYNCYPALYALTNKSLPPVRSELRKGEFIIMNRGVTL